MDERAIASAVSRWTREHCTEMVNDLMRLIAVKSIAEYSSTDFSMGKECAEAADRLIGLGNQYGLDTENDDYYNVSLLLRGTENFGELGILGHLDVVEPGSGWRSDPFQPYEEKGVVYGRGSMDNKGPLIAGLYALRCMKEIGIRTRRTIRLIAGCDEERDMKDISHFLARHSAPDFTLICDGAWPVCAGEKGLIKACLVIPLQSDSLVKIFGGSASNHVPDYACAVLESPHSLAERSDPKINFSRIDTKLYVNAFGKTSHCSTPRNGSNAILELIDFLCANNLPDAQSSRMFTVLKKCFIDHEGTGLGIRYASSKFGYTTCVPTVLSWQNGLLSLEVDIRYPFGQSGELVIRKLSERCKYLGYDLLIQKHFHPYVFSETSPIGKLLIQNCERHLSQKCKPYTTGGMTYARHFPHSVPYGPSYLSAPRKPRCGQPHAPNEGVQVDQLLEAVKVYVIALVKLDAFLDEHPDAVVPYSKS